MTGHSVAADPSGYLRMTIRTFFLAGVVVCLSTSLAFPQAPATTPATTQARTKFPRPEVKYEHGPDSKRKEGVPRGKIETFTFKDSKVFPGTIRRCAVYVPAQYVAAKPAALLVFQDGVGTYLPEDREYRVPIVFDNLIAAKEMPVTIGVFVDPGFKRDELPKPEDKARPENRSFEYDTLSADYVRFILDEILPHVQREYKLNITDDPDGRSICGQSSGGICAFNAAWERPDEFHKVVSQIGSFTNIRGGHVYPDLVRNAENKPIRVFLQDGINDNRSRQLDRNWVLANYRMAAAFEEKDYDYKYVLGEGPHSANHGGTIFPDTMRWLWRDYPKE
jgi:enterochelin esterase-like enzyme